MARALDQNGPNGVDAMVVMANAANTWAKVRSWLNIASVEHVTVFASVTATRTAAT